MNESQEPSPDPRPARRLPFVILAAALAIAAIILVTAWVLPMLRGGGSAAPTAAVTPAPGPAAAPAPAVENPGPTIEASRDTTPRTKKKAEAPPPPVVEPAAPTTGELHIDSDVAGAMVFLDRKFIGNAPVTAKDITPGSHRLNVTAEGYEGYAEPIEVAVGPAEVMVKFKEIRLKQTVDVVHKHAMGSCEGRLLADPEGIRYETTNKEDAFTLKFSEIETFEVDYLKKNLRIKKRGGKQYNFTTRAQNADPLFVFHRDVDKVRLQVTGAAPARK
jgi:hypothetical protein